MSDDAFNPAVAALSRTVRNVRRRRPLLRGLRWIRRGLVAVLVLYVLLVGYFYAGRPNPKVDYLAILNRAALQTPPDQRAWPMYRQAILSMGRPGWPEFIGAAQDGSAWPQLAAFVAAHGADIELVRRAANQPALGFILGSHGSIEDPALYRRRPRSEAMLVDPQDWRFISDLRRIGLILSIDASAARLDHDGPRFMHDISALLGMARQLRPATATLAESLAGVNINYFALQQIDAALVRAPAMLRDAELAELSTRLDQWQSAGDFLRLEGDRLIFEDLIQHVYTDDGSGNGRMTPEGWLRTRLSFAEPGAAEFVSAPLSLLEVASRRSVLQKYDEFVALKESELHLPARDSIGYAERRELLDHSHPDRLWPAFAVISTNFAPPYIGSCEILLGDRDGVVVAIALERYRRSHAKYPNALNVLVPHFLPGVPADRITGDPIKYALRSGKPLLYSVGCDRIDNGGRPGIGMCGPDPVVAAAWPPMYVSVPGDWILYPHAK